MTSYGRTTIAESKMMFYPTDRIEQYRLFFFLSDVGRTEITTRKLVDNFYGKQYHIDEINQLYVPNLYKNSYRFNYYYPWFYLLEKEDFELLDMIFSNKNKESQAYIKRTNGVKKYTVVCDLFTGESEWLSLFGLWNDVITIGNEIEQNRYEKSKEKNIDILFNKAYEEIILPKNSIDIMLFNPPYGQNNGIRNSYYYLKDIIEKQYVKEGGYIICVLRKQDMEDCIELMLSSCTIHLLYKFNDKEYEKYQQFACILKIEQRDLGQDYTLRRLNEKFRYLSVLKQELNFQTTTVMNSLRFFPPAIETKRIDFKEYIANNIIYRDKKIHSNFNDTLWRNIKKETIAPDIEIHKIIMPKTPKYNELSNIIASGYINSDFDERDEVPHVAVGGVQQVIDNVSIYDDLKQKKDLVYKKAVPYLKILYINQEENKYKYYLKNIKTNE